MPAQGQSHDPQDELDPGGLDDIDVDECWELLASQKVGRLAVMVGHYPHVVPVNYAVDGRHIMFRTGPGPKLSAIERSNVTFEVDLPVPRGWSVMVQGVARELLAEHNVELAERSTSAGAVPWAPGPRDHLVRIIPDRVTGHRIRPGDLPDAFGAHGER